jgi:hypothetical protein
MDLDADIFSLKKFNGTTYTTLATASFVGLGIGTLFRMHVTVDVGTGGGEVNLTIVVSDVSGAHSATIGPVSLHDYFPSNGLFGLYSDRSAASFYAFKIGAL